MQLVSICGPRLHQIKQIVIPAYQVVRLNFDCEGSSLTSLVKVNRFGTLPTSSAVLRNRSTNAVTVSSVNSENRARMFGEREHLRSHRDYRC